MTREGAVAILIRERDEDPFMRTEYREQIHEALNMAIKALEQEPTLDKIRAEISAIAINGQVDEHTMFIRTGEQVKQMALDIIDKYKEESEEV